MAKQLTDKQKKKIIADYIETQNYSETGRMNNCADNSVRRVIQSEDMQEFAKIVEEKKEQNTKDILEYVDNKAEIKKEIIDLIYNKAKERLEQDKATLNSIAVLYGVIMDKELKCKELSLKNKEIDKTERKEIVIVNDMPKDDDVDEEDNN